MTLLGVRRKHHQIGRVFLEEPLRRPDRIGVLLHDLPHIDSQRGYRLARAVGRQQLPTLECFADTREFGPALIPLFRHVEHVESGLGSERDLERVRKRHLAAFGEVRRMEYRLNGADGRDRGVLPGCG